MIDIIRKIVHNRFHDAPKKLERNISLAELNGETVVIKSFANETSFDRECRILDHVAHIPGCIHYIKKEKLSIYMPHCRGGDLFEYYMSHRDEFTLEKISGVICQLCDILDNLHNEDIYHLDVKLENICLLDNNLCEICVIDFGGAVIMDNNELKMLIGTTSYMSPECIKIRKLLERGSRVYKESIKYIDTWAIGVIAFSLIYGTHPFVGGNIRAKILRLDYKFPGDKDVPQEVKDVISRIFVTDGERRPKLLDIRSAFSKYSEKKYKICWPR